ncbi:IclR helix-turn-helix domain-containing protein [Halogranum amylolyticum]|uniref:IclR helix-turn-helix domain-containing protein n=1 Tax=Halogranum amylolyticum TaxID=660520 RepID=A0A1H8SGM8_9EURY|nr:helix-turn-helix domain-containing protein [Halogranum amylolyticum]SEO77821.1 IclR helix-turn-helix domain-containing protein [Halogranum amylolyticum]
MLEDATNHPDDALEDMAHLSRSANRLQLLKVIATGSYTPRILSESTDIPRSTLRRILTEMVERGWAERTADGEYVATRSGKYVSVETERYVRALDAIRTLGEAVSWLPEEELTIGLHHFSDATVRRPEPNAVGAGDTRLIDLFRVSDVFSCLVNTAPTVGLEQAMVESVVDGDLQTKHVITADELDVLRQDTDRSTRWKKYVGAGANLYCYDGSIPCILFIFDETVLIGNRRLESIAFVETENEVVRSWGHDLIEAYRKRSESLDTAAFDTDSAGLSGSEPC